MKKLFIFLIVGLMLINISFAITTYTSSGGSSEGNYQAGTGIFDETMTDYDITTKALSDGKHNYPLVADLDGNSINEIVIHDGSLIRVFDASDMSEYTAYDMGEDVATSNMILFDIDDDSYIEIILGLEDATVEDMRIMEFNGTDVNNDTSFQIAPASLIEPQYMIGCGVTALGRQCLLVAPSDFDTNSNTNIRILTFNYSGVSSNTVLANSLGGGFKHCLPKIRNIVYDDLNNDGQDDFVFSTMQFYVSGNDLIHVWAVNIQADGNYNWLLNLSDDVSANPITALFDCRDAGAYFTSPLVHDIQDVNPANRPEIVVGVSISDETFKIFSYKSDGTFIDDYPEVGTADGKIISNVMLTNAFAGSGINDFCVMGFEDVEDEIDLLCGNERNVISPEHHEFKFSISGLYNITNNYEDWNVMTHSAQHSEDETTVDDNTADLSEIVTSYGIFELDWDNAFSFLSSIDTLNLIWENPQNDGVLISVDAQQVNIPDGSEDLIFLTDTNLYYYDDGLTNSLGQIAYYSVDPCIDSGAWKINTTVEVVVNVEDADEDDVSARATLYYDDGNEVVSGFDANYSSGTDIPFTFTANKTITSATLRLEGRDTENPTVIHTVDVPFSVALVGLELGDCITTTEVTAITIPDECSDSDDCPTGYICLSSECVEESLSLPALARVEAEDTLNMPITVIWLMLMLGMALGIWFAPMSKKETFFDSSIAKVTIIFIAEILFLILGTYFGYLPVAIIISIIILSLIVIGLWVSKQMTNTGA